MFAGTDGKKALKSNTKKDMKVIEKYKRTPFIEYMIFPDIDTKVFFGMSFLFRIIYDLFQYFSRVSLLYSFIILFNI